MIPNQRLQKTVPSQNAVSKKVHILPVKSKSLTSIKALFSNLSPKFTIRKSSNNNYQSLTVKVEIDSAKSVVDIYAKTSSFKDVISL